jgi:murein DD-endopeptidase MepM/ murein hydrolase activator NlpD
VRTERKVRISRDSGRRAATGADRRAAARRGHSQETSTEPARLAGRAERAAAEIAPNLWRLPLAPGGYRLTARFGECSALWSQCHTGLDFAAPSGTPVLSVTNGVVTEASYAGAYGNRVVVALEDGTEIWYCHLTSFGVAAGNIVVGGTTVGTVGTTGNATGPHLHLEIRPGGEAAVDPFEALAGHGVTP